jgi:hypothetical protein
LRHSAPVDIEWLRGDRRVGEGHIEYADVAAAGGTMRLPTSGRVVVRASGPNRALVSGAQATITFSYREFEQVRAP